MKTGSARTLSNITFNVTLFADEETESWGKRMRQPSPRPWAGAGAPMGGSFMP